MAVTVGISVIAVYIFLHRSLNEQLNTKLLALTHAKTPSLVTVKTRGSQSLDEDLLPQHSLFNQEQGLEWFDAEGKLLAKKGTVFPNFPLARDSSLSHLHKSSHIIQHQGQVRTLTIAVYARDLNQQTLRLEGYLRASESTEEMQARLDRLRVGLGLGGITALILSSISSVYLTRLALEPIRQSFQRLKYFTTDVSHELRNPLTAINTTVEVMQSHPEQLDPRQAKKLAIIASATDQMTRLVEDQLFLVRIDATDTPSRLEWSLVPLDKVLEDLVERFQPQAQSKGINFEAHLLTGIFINGDASQLSRLFSNLLENAFKYTETGRVILSLTRRRRFAVVSVKDTGIGISPEYLPFIFQRLLRTDRARLQQREGHGLGLAIAQAIAYQHGGKITVSSQVGVGSCFRVYLPI
jgi:signal transduction histidine kinase